MRVRGVGAARDHPASDGSYGTHLADRRDALVAALAGRRHRLQRVGAALRAAARRSCRPCRAAGCRRRATSACRRVDQPMQVDGLVRAVERAEARDAASRSRRVAAGPCALATASQAAASARPCASNRCSTRGIDAPRRPRRRRCSARARRSAARSAARRRRRSTWISVSAPSASTSSTLPVHAAARRAGRTRTPSGRTPTKPSPGRRAPAMRGRARASRSPAPCSSAACR